MTWKTLPLILFTGSVWVDWSYIKCVIKIFPFYFWNILCYGFNFFNSHLTSQDYFGYLQKFVFDFLEHVRLCFLDINSISDHFIIWMSCGFVSIIIFLSFHVYCSDMPGCFLL